MLHNLTLDSLRRSIITSPYIPGPFGLRKLIYADHTASGRFSDIVERYLRERVMVWYGNTHSEGSEIGRQMTRMREIARKVIRESFKAGDEYAVIFAGQGTTSAINKLVDVLGIKIPANLNAIYRLSDYIPQAQKPVILVGPWEHHSNELPWRESIGSVAEVELGEDGNFDLKKLDDAIKANAGRPLIGSFSAASNVTGAIAPIKEIAKKIHDAGGLVFFDCAAIAPHDCIDLPEIDADAIFFSGHKFIGGPESPGVLIAKKKLFTNPVPSQPGGGTVSCVTPDGHWYLDDIERREEAGTPGIVGSIRLGLAFTMRDQIGCKKIQQIESIFRDRAIKAWEKEPSIRILGDSAVPSLPIISFEINAPQPSASKDIPDEYRGKKIHHNFVVTLLNDLFGVQSRGGCMCAGPYTVRLMGACPLEDCSGGDSPEILRPGFTRVSFNFLTTDEEVDYIIKAVIFIAREGYKFLPLYRYDAKSGAWTYHGVSRQNATRIPSVPETFNLARKLVPAASANRESLQGEDGMMCWFLVPKEV